MNSTDLETKVAIIGAGVIGLSAGEKISRRYSTLILEENEKFGQVTSSRNSEVIHSGIHYPENSLKTKWCIQGRELLYDYCKKRNVPYKKIGKLIIATNENEEKEIYNIKCHCDRLEIRAKNISQSEIKKKEPDINAMSALFLPETGVFDSHSFMASLEAYILSNGGIIAYRHEVIKIEPKKNGWLLTVKKEKEIFTIFSSIVINAAGLKAAFLSNMALNEQKYEHKFCLGRYFLLKTDRKFHSLIYPVPSKDGLGVHITVDMADQVRIGPDTEWIEEKNLSNLPNLYKCNWDILYSKFLILTKKLYPKVKKENLSPQLVGIRPKLFIHNTQYHDFLVENHGGFIHCLGIESPGLTSALACADYLEKMVH